MISKKEFCKIIDNLKRNDEFLNELGDVFRKYQKEDQIYSTGLEDTVVNLLELVFKDKESQWIAYWIWELNFGETYVADDIKDENDNNISLKTAEELYDFLINNMEKKRVIN